MKRSRFPLSSDQLELLLAFEATSSLAVLAEFMRRDASVVSRALQRLASDAPVIEKRGTRWEITPLGRRINERSRAFLGDVGGLIAKGHEGAPYQGDRAVLIVLNAQKAIQARPIATRSNPDAETKIQRLLAHWRGAKKTVLHLKHASRHLDSAYHPSHATSAFLPDLAPLPGEWVMEKITASAFVETRLAAELQERGIDTLVLTGFTANECIDSTARHAVDLGFNTFVVGDATAMFDLVGPDGEILPAAKTQETLLASLHAGFARVLKTDGLLAELSGP